MNLRTSAVMPIGNITSIPAASVRWKCPTTRLIGGGRLLGSVPLVLGRPVPGCGDVTALTGILAWFDRQLWAHASRKGTAPQ